MSFLKDALAEAWADHLAAATELPFFPHRHDGETLPPFGVVLVKRMEQTTPGSNVWTAEVRVVMVSDTSATLSAAHSTKLETTREAIEETPIPSHDADRGVSLFGFMLEEVEQATATDDQGRKIYSDVFMLTAGVGPWAA